MEKKTPVMQRIKAALDDLPNRVTVGFEVETQVESESDVNTDGMMHYAHENINTSDVCNQAGVGWDHSWVRALGCDGDPERLAEALSVDWDDLLEGYVEGMDERDWTVEGADWDAVGGDVCRRLNRQSGLSWNYCDDASVSGPEFQTPVFNGRDAAIQGARQLFSAIGDCDSMSIDSECSCHIHLRMKDVFHTGHNILQQLLFEELFNDLDAIPDCIKKRCATDPRWIRPTPDGGDTYCTKFNPLQRHNELGTWEFRLFGNVSNSDDFELCLDAAIAAMHRAYTRFMEGDRRELPAQLWCDLALRAMVDWVPIQSFAEYGKFWAIPAVVASTQQEDQVLPVPGILEFANNQARCNCEECVSMRIREAELVEAEEVC